MADSPERAQYLLHRCTTWAADNNMSFGLAKCQAITSPSHPLPSPLLLSGHALSTTTTYKYLGFPLGASGIRWIKHGTDSIARAHAFLHHLSLTSLHWPEWVKLLVYKTFIRSLTTYGLHLSYHYARTIEPDRPSHRALLTDITKLHKKALRWIFGRTISQAAMEAMTALGSPFRHLDELLASFVIRIPSIGPRNPLSTHIDRLSLAAPLWPASYFLPRLTTSPLAYRYRAHRLPRPTWDVWKRADRVAALHLEAGILHLYIDPSCRHPTSKIDACLLIPDPLLRAKAIAWRLNRAFHGRFCPVCSEPFNRSHLAACELLHHHPYHQAQAATLHLAERALPAQAPNFCLLDLALNNRAYSDFSRLHSYLSRALMAHPPG